MLGDSAVAVDVNLTENFVEAIRRGGVFGAFDALAGRDVVQNVVYEFLSLAPIQQTVAVRIVFVPNLDHQSFQRLICGLFALLKLGLCICCCLWSG